jgi:hypothetical protein
LPEEPILMVLIMIDGLGQRHGIRIIAGELKEIMVVAGDVFGIMVRGKMEIGGRTILIYSVGIWYG